MNASTTPESRAAAVAIADRVGDLQRRRPGALVIAVDGPSGAGKSTVAALAAEMLSGVVIPTDDFYRANVTDAEWDAMFPAERAERAIDWERVRREVIGPLREGRPASWHAFDFAAGRRADGTYPMRRDATVRLPAPVVVLDGAYSARPELADVIDLAVYVGAPQSVRRERLASREAEDFLQAWLVRWVPAEDHYFSTIRPMRRFDLVVSTASVPVDAPPTSA